MTEEIRPQSFDGTAEAAVAGIMAQVAHFYPGPADARLTQWIMQIVRWAMHEARTLEPDDNGGEDT